MTTINQLSALTAFDADDKLPVWQTANSDTRSGTVGLLADFIEAAIGGNSGETFLAAKSIVFVTDFDTPQDAYNGGNKTVVWPAGTYQVSQYIRVYANTKTIYHPGVVIEKTFNTGNIFCNATYGDTTTTGYNGSGNIHFEGPVQFVLGTGGARLQAYGIVHAENISIRGGTVYNLDIRHAIELNACKNCRISEFSVIGHNVVAGDEDVSEAIQYDGAIDAGRFPLAPGAADGTTCRDIWIEDCYFDGVYTAYGTHGDAVMTNYNIHFLNNTIKNPKHDGEHIRWLDGGVASGQIIIGAARRATLPRQCSRVIFDNYTIIDPSNGNSVSAVFFYTCDQCVWGPGSYIGYTSAPQYTRPIEIGSSGNPSTATLVYEGYAKDGTNGGIGDNGTGTTIIYGKSGKTLDTRSGEPVNIAQGMVAPETVANLAAPSTTGWQGFEFDNINGYIYATNIDPVAVPDTITVCRFDMAGNLLDQSSTTTALGHGADLGIEWRKDGANRLWSGNLAGDGATRFSYNAGGAISNVQNYVLFSGYTTTQVGISYGGRYLVAQAGAGGVRKVRVFDLEVLAPGGGGDYSNEYLYEFTLDAAQSTPPFQGITADDRFVYTLSGTSSISDDKLIYVYTLSGTLVAAYPAVQVGKTSAAASGPGTYWEPEGFGWVETATGSPVLTVGMAQAGGMKLWGLGAGLYQHVTAPSGLLFDPFNGGQIFCNSGSGRSIFTLRGGKTTTGSSVLLYGDTDPTNPGRLQLQCRNVGTSTTYSAVLDPTSSGAFRPGTTNAQNLGTTAARWDQALLNTWVQGVRVVTASGGITALSNDSIVVVNKTVGAATAVTLMAAPATGQTVTIKDGKGDANVNNITITPAAGTIDGAANKVINTAYGSLALVYNGTQWNVV